MSTFYLCGVSLGLFVFIVATVNGPTWLAVVGIVAAYGAAFSYRQEIRRPKRQKGARR